MATDDFTFPTHNSPCTIDSPPLWRLSPAPSSKAEEDYDHELEEIIKGAGDDDVNYHNPRRKSFSHIKRGGRKMGDEDEESSDHDHEEENKMDMLWENFNEDLMSRTTVSDYSGGLSREMLKLGCARAFKLSKTNGAVVSTRKPSVMPIVKVLKRLFSHHSSQQKLKKPAW